MKVFVAGATGAIGRQLVPRLVGAGHQVFGMTRSAAKREMIAGWGAQPILADALDARSMAEALQAVRPEVVIHQLTAIGDPDTRHMERSFAATNRLRTGGTDILLAAAGAAGVRRFIAQSNVTSFAGPPVRTETDPLDVDPPGAMWTNIFALQYLERAVLGAAWAEGVVLRYGWLYGPGTTLTPGGQTFEMIRRRQFPIVGKGGGIWSFVHVADAAAATVAAIRAGAGIYNIVDDDPAPVAEWLPALARQLGARPPFRVPRFIGRLAAGEAAVALLTESRGAANAKAKRELGWQPAHPSWRDGLVPARRLLLSSPISPLREAIQP